MSIFHTFCPQILYSVKRFHSPRDLYCLYEALSHGSQQSLYPRITSNKRNLTHNLTEVSASASALPAADQDLNNTSVFVNPTIASKSPTGHRSAMPSQPPPVTTSDGSYTPPPPLLPHTPAPPLPETPTTLKALSRTQLIDRLILAEQRLSSYRTAASDLLSALTLTPDMTEAFYARSLRELLSAALVTLDSVEELSHVECSFPCVKAEMPSVELVQWRGLSYSEWNVDWAPDSWWVSASALGSRWGFGFNCLTTVTGIHLTGCLRCSFSNDMTSVRVGFRETPDLEMDVESVVGWGVVPIPVRESIEEMVRSEIERFVKDRLTEDSVVVVLRRKATGVSDGDLQEARLQARRAGSVILRSQTLL